MFENLRNWLLRQADRGRGHRVERGDQTSADVWPADVSASEIEQQIADEQMDQALARRHAADRSLMDAAAAMRYRHAEPGLYGLHARLDNDHLGTARQVIADARADAAVERQRQVPAREPNPYVPRSPEADEYETAMWGDDAERLRQAGREAEAG